VVIAARPARGGRRPGADQHHGGSDRVRQLLRLSRRRAARELAGAVAETALASCCARRQRGRDAGDGPCVIGVDVLEPARYRRGGGGPHPPVFFCVGSCAALGWAAGVSPRRTFFPLWGGAVPVPPPPVRPPPR